MIKTNSGAVFAAVSATILSGLFLFMPETVSAATSRALTLCAARVIPSVFPFSVLSSLFVSSGGDAFLDRALSPASRCLFGTRRGASALVMGLLFGFPLGALTVGEQCRAGTITKKEASRLLAFVCCASPTFPVFVVGKGYFGSTAVGLSIWVTQAVTSVLIGALTARTSRTPKRTSAITPAAPPNDTDASFFSLVTRAVTDASRVMLNVCGSVTFFSIVSAVTVKLIEPVCTSPLPRLLISAVFEFSSGTAAAYEACAAGNVSRAAAVAICGFSIGFAGLSVMFQTASVCDDIPLFPHLCGKLACGLVTAVVTYFIASSPAFAPTFSADAQPVLQTYPVITLIELVSAILLIIFILYVIFRSKQKS